MKIFMYFVLIELFAFSTLVYSESWRDSNGRPCYDVNVQINRDNMANVRQNCDVNISRTAQAGKNNSANTSQSGNTNSNQVRQYEFNAVQRRDW